MDSILLDNDARKLRKFGYTQAFTREFTLLTNFSVSLRASSLQHMFSSALTENKTHCCMWLCRSVLASSQR